VCCVHVESIFQYDAWASYFLSPFLNTVSERATILSLVFAHQSDSYELLAVQGMTTGANDDYGNLGKTHIGEGVRAPRLYDSIRMRGLGTSSLTGRHVNSKMKQLTALRVWCMLPTGRTYTRVLVGGGRGGSRTANTCLALRRQPGPALVPNLECAG